MLPPAATTSATSVSTSASAGEAHGNHVGTLFFFRQILPIIIFLHRLGSIVAIKEPRALPSTATKLLAMEIISFKVSICLSR
jgi:hypothetical protein